MARTFKLENKDDDYSVKITQSKTSQGHHMSPVNKAVLIKKKQRKTESPVDSRQEKRGRKKSYGRIFSKKKWLELQN